MKSARKKKEKVKEVPAMQNVKKKETSQRKSTKCPKERRRKSKGNDVNVLSGKEELSTRSNVFARDTQNPSDTVILTRQSGHIPVTVPQPSAKIKLQLFPVDDSVRIELEKDGYNPYLELTLSSRKKISSVLRHLGKKWGSSNIAQGELMLFPHNVVLENLASYGRWTLNDIGITAGDIHKAVGSPAIFRLRYGWFKPSSFCVPLVSDSFPLVKESELAEKDLTATLESEHDTEHQIQMEDNGLKVHSVTLMAENQTPVEANELKPSNTTELATVPPVELCSTPESVQGPNKDYGILQPSALLSDLSNISFGTLLSKVSPQGKPNLPSALLSDLSNISFGALLSEASLHGKPNQPSTLLSDRSNMNVGALLSEASLQGKPNQPSSTMLSDQGNTSIGALLSEASLQGKPNQPPALWSDLSNISIGGLLSDASLQGKPNFFNTKLNESRSAFSQLFTDSLDAFFGDQLKSTHDPKISHSSPSSIFDTEVACDSFSFRKSLATPKDFSSLAGSDTFAACVHDVVSEGNRSSKMTELIQQERIQSDTSEQGVLIPQCHRSV